MLDKKNSWQLCPVLCLGTAVKSWETDILKYQHFPVFGYF